jgi:hypothetical protein
MRYAAKNGKASTNGSRDRTAAPNSSPISAARASSWQARIARSMKKVATTWANCQDEPAWAEYQTMVPKANTSDSTSRGPRVTPIARRIVDMIATLAAPMRIEAQACSKPGPTSHTAGRTTSAGIGG